MPKGGREDMVRYRYYYRYSYWINFENRVYFENDHWPPRSYKVLNYRDVCNSRAVYRKDNREMKTNTKRKKKETLQTKKNIGTKTKRPRMKCKKKNKGNNSVPGTSDNNEQETLIDSIEKMGKKRRKGKAGKGKVKTFGHYHRYWVRLQNVEEKNDADEAENNQELPSCSQNINNGNKNVPDTFRQENSEKTNNTNDQNIKETMVILKIPSAVISQVVSNIEEIETLAENNKIPLRGTQCLIKEIKLEELPVKSEEVKENDENSISLLGPSTSTTSIIKTKNSQTTQPSGLKRPSDESVDILSFNIDTKKKIQKITEVHPSAQSLGTMKIKTEPSDEIDSPRNMQALEVPLPLTEVKLEQNFTPIQVKTEPIDDDDVVFIGSSKPLIPKASIGDYQPQSEFIPVKDEPIESKGSLRRELLLRDGAHYKYGYRDIITESFQEKLDENLAKGITICKQTPETEVWNNIFLEDYNDMLTRPQYKEIMAVREKLPAFKRAADLVDVINNDQVVIICGETGCGKSTQVPQIILDDAIRKGKGAHTHVLVTQPRRIAASSLAMRVAQERAEDLGNCVGYAVRLEKHLARFRGSIMYVTTGILLAELEMKQGLTQYSHIILDEVHERDTNIDFSMCMLKEVLKKRSDLKVIIMSATMNSAEMSTYFDDCPVIHIKGIAYPVQQYYLEDVLKMTGFQLDRVYPWHGKMGPKPRAIPCRQRTQYQDEISPWIESVKRNLPYHVSCTLRQCEIEFLNIDLIIVLLDYICKGPPGAILVFLPGLAAITKLIRLMKQSRMFPENRYWIFPVHSRISTSQQHRIFRRPPNGVRKIVIATNIAETSITIEDIEYVVDCGWIKIKGLDVERNLSTLKDEFESKANLIQRRGRAGRCQSGIAFHLLTSYRAKTLPDRHLPELQRSDLFEAVLQIKQLRLGNAQDALKLVPDPPQEVTVDMAVKHLQQCGALDDEERLTPLGWHMARLPVHPAAGKLLLLGALFGCLDRAASVAAVWGFKDPFVCIIGMDDKIDAAKRKLTLGEPSDHVAISEALLQWEQLDKEQRIRFAHDHYLSIDTMGLLVQMKHQLCDDLRLMGFLASRNVRVAWENRNADNLCVFKAVVAAALYPNIGMVRWSKSWLLGRQQSIQVSTPEDGKVCLHQSSVMVVTPPRPRYEKHDTRPNLRVPLQNIPRIPLCDNPGANWLVYWLKQKSVNLYLFEVTLVFTIPLLLFGELVVSKVEDSPDECYMSVSTVKVRCQKETADVLFKLRSFLDQVLTSMVMETSDRSTRHSEFDELVFKAVIDLMTTEDVRPEELEDDSDPEPQPDFGGPGNTSSGFIPLF